MTAEWTVLLLASRTAADEAARAAAARRRAGEYLWAGTKALVEEWNGDADPMADDLYVKALDAIGKNRKGSASKMRTVALATRDLDLPLYAYASLNEAYRNAKRLAEVESA